MSADIRWKQRFQNFDRAYSLLSDALKDGPDKLSILEKAGVVQRFEFTFELAWKTMKDFMEYSGMNVPLSFPRDVIKQAFSASLIHDGQLWIDMLQDRNKLSHIYDESLFESAVAAISAKYMSALGTLHRELEARLNT